MWPLLPSPKRQQVENDRNVVKEEVDGEVKNIKDHARRLEFSNVRIMLNPVHGSISILGMITSNRKSRGRNRNGLELLVFARPITKDTQVVSQPYDITIIGEGVASFDRDTGIILNIVAILLKRVIHVITRDKTSFHVRGKLTEMVMPTQLVTKLLNGRGKKVAYFDNFRVSARPKMIAFATHGFAMEAQRVSFETSFEKHIVTSGGSHNDRLNNRWVKTLADGLDIASGNGLASHEVRIGIVITSSRNAIEVLAKLTVLLVGSLKVRGDDPRGKVLTARISAEITQRVLNPRLGGAKQIEFQLITLEDIQLMVDGSSQISKHSSQSTQITDFEGVHILEVPEVVLEIMRKSAIK
jgi:hypothetical protein